jgi:hypothetical protein
MTRDTVGTDTPASRAIAAMVTLRLSSATTGCSFVTGSTCRPAGFGRER